MGSLQILYLILICICLLLSAFFSSSETAFIALQKVKVKQQVSAGVAGAARVAKMMERPEKFLATILLGNNLVNTAAAALGTALAVSLWGAARGVLIATVGITVLLLIFGETIPKTIAAQHAERVSLFYIRPVEVISWLLSPAAVALGRLGGWASRLIGGEEISRALVSEEEIRTIISMGREEGVVEESEADMLHKIFEFGDRQVREVMTPRPDIIWLERDFTPADFLAIYSKFPHSRFPVYKENIDRVEGLISIKDVLMAEAEGTLQREETIAGLVRPAYFVPETKRVGELFNEMQSLGYQMAMVIDEYGGIAGMVTLEQLIEEIVGEVRDELVKETKDYAVVNEHAFQVDGGMRLDEVNDELGLQLPSGDYETVAGFVLDVLGHIPYEGEKVRYADLSLVVTEMKGMRIEKVLIERISATEKEHAASED